MGFRVAIIYFFIFSIFNPPYARGPLTCCNFHWQVHFYALMVFWNLCLWKKRCILFLWSRGRKYVRTGDTNGQKCVKTRLMSMVSKPINISLVLLLHLGWSKNLGLKSFFECRIFLRQVKFWPEKNVGPKRFCVSKKGKN